MATNARDFNGAGDEVQCALGSIVAFNPGTVAAIVKADTTGSTIVIFGAGDSGGSSWTFYKNSDETLGFWSGAASTAGSTAMNATDWWLVAVTRASGASVTPRMHLYNYTTDAWTHENAAGAVAVGSNPSGSLWVAADNGGGGFWWNGKIQVCGYWTSALSDGALEGLTDTLASWEASSPAGLWPLNQDSTSTAVEDTIGTADQTALVGTTVAAGNPEWADVDPWVPEENSAKTLHVVTAPRF